MRGGGKDAIAQNLCLLTQIDNEIGVLFLVVRLVGVGNRHPFSLDPYLQTGGILENQGQIVAIHVLTDAKARVRRWIGE